jgi:hypothetical protein
MFPPEKQDGFSVCADRRTDAPKIVKQNFSPLFGNPDFPANLPRLNIFSRDAAQVSGRAPVRSSLACQEFQNGRKSSVRHNEGKVVREEFYGNDVLSYQLPETIVPVSVSWYKQKVKVSGNVVKVREYEILQQKGGEKAKSEKPLKERTLAEIAKQDKANANRARDKIIDILNSNFGMRSRVDCEGNKSVKFLTLTYKENETNLDRVHNDFTLFLKRMEYELKDKVIYLAVPEKQERGAWHIHAMLYSKYIPLSWLLDNWNKTRGQGSFRINEVKDVGNLGKYVAKYVSKTFMEGGVLPGRKRYWHSEGLKDKSTVVYTRQSPFRLLDFVDYFDGCIDTKKDGQPAVRMGSYGDGNEYTGRVDFLDITLKSCSKDVKCLLKALETWVSTE